MAQQKVNAGQIRNPYMFSAYRATTQAAGTCIFDVERLDTNNNYNNATGEYTCPITGYYQFNATTGQPVTAAPQDPSATLQKNGATVAVSQFVNMYNGASSGSANISAFINCAAGDVIRVYAARGLNGSVNTFSGFLVSV